MLIEADRQGVLRAYAGTRGQARYLAAFSARTDASFCLSQIPLSKGASLPHLTWYAFPDELLLDAARSMNCSVL